MNNDIIKTKIIQEHGKRKGVSLALKLIVSNLKSQIDAQEDRVESTRQEMSFYGGFDDCGDFYIKEHEGAKAELVLMKQMLAYNEALLVPYIKESSALIGLEKQNLRENHGVSEVDSVERLIWKVGQEKHLIDQKLAKDNKGKNKALKQLVLSLTSNRYEHKMRHDEFLLDRKDLRLFKNVSREIEREIDKLNGKAVSKDHAAKIISGTRSNVIKDTLVKLEPAVTALEQSLPKMTDNGAISLATIIVKSYKEWKEKKVEENKAE